MHFWFILCLHLWIVIQYETEEIFKIEFQKNYFTGYVPEKHVISVRSYWRKDNPTQKMNQVKETSCAIIFYPDQIVVPLTLEHLWSITNSCIPDHSLWFIGVLIRTWYHSLLSIFYCLSKLLYIFTAINWWIKDKGSKKYCKLMWCIT